jgi:hypothetical protein
MDAAKHTFMKITAELNASASSAIAGHSND